MDLEEKRDHFVKTFNPTRNPLKFFGVVLTVALVLGVGTGFTLANSNNSGVTANIPLIEEKPKSAAQDNRTFRDFAEGKIELKPKPKAGQDYGEGTHILVREKAVPVALTSSVVDLNLYEGKKVKVFGETQKAIKEGWLMDVGKVEEVN